MGAQSQLRRRDAVLTKGELNLSQDRLFIDSDAITADPRRPLARLHDSASSGP